ncbi:MAG: hypothetical protein H0T95_12795, partial [Chthoniobacterales bacterium]|nr:hypothetical protein [Chthoniobacterales bacterium]
LRYGRSPEQLALAASAIEALQRLRPDSGEAHLALAKHVYWGYLDYKRARKELEIARRALPNDPVPPLLTGYIDRREGRWPEANANLLRALELDPRNSVIPEQLSRAYSSLHRYPEMAAMLDRAISLTPHDPVLRAKRATVELDWRADPKPLHDTIEAVLTANPSMAAAMAPHWFHLSLHERDHASAAKALALLGPDGCREEAVPFPDSWCAGVVARLGGDEAAAQAAFQKARAEAEKLFLEQPEYAGAACALAMAEAAVGNKADAIRLGRRAVELLPISRDAVDGVLLAESLAIIYAWTGETDLAIQQLEIVTRHPSYLSYGNLRLHPEWDPLRGDPRFEQIVQSLAPK